VALFALSAISGRAGMGFEHSKEARLYPLTGQKQKGRVSCSQIDQYKGKRNAQSA
jgi:hypothetical protein